MRKVLYYAVMALVASSVMVACEKDNNGDDNGGGTGGGTTVRLAVPQLSIVDTTDNGIVVGWAEIANAATYDVVLNDDEANMISVSETQYEVLTPEGGTYRVRVRSVPAEGSEYTESQWSATLEFSVRAASGEIPAEYQPWIGFWTVSSDKSVKWAPDPADPQYVSPQIVDEPKTAEVEFYYSPDAIQDESGNPIGCRERRSRSLHWILSRSVGRRFLSRSLGYLYSGWRVDNCERPVSRIHHESQR